MCLALAINNDLRASLEEAFLGETPTDPDARGTTFSESDIRTFVKQKFDIDYVQNYGWLTRNIYTGAGAFRRDFTIQRDGNAFYFIFQEGQLSPP